MEVYSRGCEGDIGKAFCACSVDYSSCCAFALGLLCIGREYLLDNGRQQQGLRNSEKNSRERACTKRILRHLAIRVFGKCSTPSRLATVFVIVSSPRSALQELMADQTAKASRSGWRTLYFQGLGLRAIEMFFVSAV